MFRLQPLQVVSKQFLALMTIREEIRHNVQMLNPYSMSQAVDKARHQERLINIQHKKERSQLSRGSYGGGSSGGYGTTRGVSNSFPTHSLNKGGLRAYATSVVTSTTSGTNVNRSTLIP